jgi:hypothetical protein
MVDVMSPILSLSAEPFGHRLGEGRRDAAHDGRDRVLRQRLGHLRFLAAPAPFGELPEK